MNIKLSLMGLGLVITIASGLLVSLFPPFASFAFILAFIGMTLFAGHYSEKFFVEYITFEDSNYVYSVKKKKYYHFIGFTVMLSVFNTDISIPYNAEYYKFTTPTLDIESIDLEKFRVDKKEYEALLESQKQQYLDKTAPKEMVADVCAPERVKVNSAKVYYIISLTFSLLCLSGLTVPSDWILVIIFEAVMVPVTIMLYKQYKKAQFKTAIYNSYFNNINNN